MAEIVRFIALAASLLFATLAAWEQSVTVNADTDHSKIASTSPVNLTTYSAQDFCKKNHNPYGATIDCFENVKRCFGIDRARAVVAVNSFCNWQIGFQYADGDSQASYTYLYTRSNSPQANMGEEGAIQMDIEVLDDGCLPPIVMAFDVCYCNMMSTIDGCDTDGSNGKHGGSATSGCLTYTLQPNPFYWPECDYMDCHDLGGEYPIESCTFTHTASEMDIFGTDAAKVSVKTATPKP